MKVSSSSFFFLIVVVALIALARTLWLELSPSRRFRGPDDDDIISRQNSDPSTTDHHPAMTATMLDVLLLQRPPSVSVGDVVVSVRFYGESMCPFCRKFVTEAWPAVWNDEGIRPYLDYDMVAWGNAYFATEECGEGPYSPDERACWYKKCIPTAPVPSPGIGRRTRGLRVDHLTGTQEECFSGPVVYQHGQKEGIVDIYETCIKEDCGLEDAVTFSYCAEGKIMDNDHLTAQQIMRVCSVSMHSVDSDKVQDCYETRGRELEIANAKITPAHPGVPYVLVDGEPLDNPLEVKKAICDRLKAKGIQDRDFPDSCREAS
jgi:Gamma interferon inducible lysosomal thiol reductase (GILT)